MDSQSTLSETHKAQLSEENDSLKPIDLSAATATHPIGAGGASIKHTPTSIEEKTPTAHSSVTGNHSSGHIFDTLDDSVDLPQYATENLCTFPDTVSTIPSLWMV
jgi:hypothetical protein